MSKTITQNERLQLQGLLVLAAKHVRMLDDIMKAAETILGGNDWFNDAVWGHGNFDVDALLDSASIEVEE